MKTYYFTILDAWTGAKVRRALSGRGRYDAIRRAAVDLAGALSPRASRCLVYDGRGRFVASVDRSAGVSFDILVAVWDSRFLF